MPYAAVRTFDQRTVLDMFAARITAVSLSGYLFFGR
jgi:SulP family sulfate permease